MIANCETALLGGLILFPEHLPQVMAVVKPDDFAGGRDQGYLRRTVGTLG